MLSSQENRIKEHIQFVRTNSPYYAKHYAAVAQGESKLERLPIVDHSNFWIANSNSASENTVLTSKFIDGFVFRTGGTTSSRPKPAFITRDELWESSKSLGRCLLEAGVVPGDSVANMFYGGDLYKGFVDVSFALMDLPIPIIHLTIGRSTNEEAIWQMEEFSATVVIAMPTTLRRLAEDLVQQRKQLREIRIVFYAGEHLPKDQKEFLREAFPNARIGPLQYVSSECGVLGLPAAPPDESNETIATYSVNAPNVIIEITDESGHVISENDREGDILVTHLARRLQPLVRYPTGDMAEWVDYPRGIFRVLRRASLAVRLGPNTYMMADLRRLVSKALRDEPTGFQVLLRRFHGMDEMVFRIAHKPENPESARHVIVDEMDAFFVEFAKEVHEGDVRPLVVEWIAFQDLYFHPRSGKLREIVDQRYEP